MIGGRDTGYSILDTRDEWREDRVDLEPEGRQHVATGVSPWNAERREGQPPQGAAETAGVHVLPGVLPPPAGAPAVFPRDSQG